MSAQTRFLVETCVVGGIVLYIHSPFPLFAMLRVVSGIVGIIRITERSRHHNARVVIEQGKRVGADGDDGKFVEITAQGTDEIGLRDHGRNPVPRVIESSGADYNGLHHGIRKVEHTFGCVLDLVDVGGRAHLSVQRERF